MVRSIEGKNFSYFEAILQLRNISSAVLDFVYAEIDRGKIHIAKEVESKNGLDIYLADDNFTRALGRKLQEQFGGENKITSTLYSQKDGKDIYRITVLFRAVPFKKGDIVKYKGSEYEVKILGKDILLQSLKTGKKVHVRCREMQQIKVKD